MSTPLNIDARGCARGICECGQCGIYEKAVTNEHECAYCGCKPVMHAPVMTALPVVPQILAVVPSPMTLDTAASPPMDSNKRSIDIDDDDENTKKQKKIVKKTTEYAVIIYSHAHYYTHDIEKSNKTVAYPYHWAEHWGCCMHLVKATSAFEAHKLARKKHTDNLLNENGFGFLRENLDNHQKKCVSDSEQARIVMKKVLQNSATKQKGKKTGWWMHWEREVNHMKAVGIQVEYVPTRITDSHGGV